MEDANNAILNFVYKAKYRIDVCLDSNGSDFLVSNNKTCRYYKNRPEFDWKYCLDCNRIWELNQEEYLVKIWLYLGFPFDR